MDTAAQKKIASVWKEALLLGLLLMGIGLVHGHFLRVGHGWGDDFAQYLLHAKNLVEGRPYAQTGYIYNPHYPQIGPPAYPPGTPVLLALIYQVWGLNWTAMKWAMIACLLAWLAVLAVYFRESLPLPVRVVLLILLGLNPFLLDQTNAIGSDLLFVVFVYLTLLFIERGDRAENGAEKHRSEHPWAWHVAAAISAWAAFATRTVGLVLWLAVLLAELIQYRRIRTSLLGATGLFLLLGAVQTRLTPGIGGYFDQLSWDPLVLLGQAVQYARQLAAFWRNGISKLLAAAVAGTISILALAGYCAQLRRRVSVRELFLVLYAGAVVVWPSYQGFRMLNPLLPLWLFYAWKGLEGRWLKRWPRFRLSLIATLAGAIGLCYGSVLLTRPTGPLPEGIGRASSQELFKAVRQHTDPEAVVIFIKPRSLALMTGRACSVYHPVQNDAELWAYFQQIHATHLVVVERPEAVQGAENPEIVQFLADFVAKNHPYLDRLWGNEDFTLYRIRKIPL